MQQTLFRPGERCGPYEIVREIGRGGMSLVYLAHGPDGDERAIKALLPKARVRADLADRFTREVQLLSYIDHVHVVRFYEAGVLDRDGSTVLWVALEYLEGETLRQIVSDRGGTVSPEKIIRWGRHIAQGVHQAHKLRVVHRDLKPENVIITHGDIAKVFDFGIAKYKSWNLKSTAAGQTLGTVAYMAPEQLEDNKTVDARADVYALGLILYELATGYHPFVDVGAPLDMHAAILRKLMGEPQPLSERVADFPPDLADIIHRSFRSDPAERFGNMQQLDDALAETRRRQMDAKRAAMLGAAASPALGAAAAVSTEVRGSEARAQPQSPQIDTALPPTAKLAGGLSPSLAAALPPTQALPELTPPSGAPTRKMSANDQVAPTELLDASHASVSPHLPTESAAHGQTAAMAMPPGMAPVHAAQGSSARFAAVRTLPGEESPIATPAGRPALMVAIGAAVGIALGYALFTTTIDPLMAPSGVSEERAPAAAASGLPTKEVAPSGGDPQASSTDRAPAAATASTSATAAGEPSAESSAIGPTSAAPSASAPSARPATPTATPAARPGAQRPRPNSTARKGSDPLFKDL